MNVILSLFIDFCDGMKFIYGKYTVEFGRNDYQYYDVLAVINNFVDPVIFSCVVEEQCFLNIFFDREKV